VGTKQSGSAMPKAQLSKAEKEALIQKNQTYFAEELDQEIGEFEAGFLLDFMNEELGPFIYNMALRDAQAALSRRMDGISNAIDELTRPTHVRK
jgi:uncharacterized protein (DUF2164 family)